MRVVNILKHLGNPSPFVLRRMRFCEREHPDESVRASEFEGVLVEKWFGHEG